MSWTAIGPIVVFLVAATTAPSTGTQPAGAPCSGTLDGRKFAHLIPEQFPWKALFERVAANSKLVQVELDLDSRTMRSVEDAGAAALQRAAAIEAAPLPTPELTVDRDEEAAEAILTGRDNLIRRLAPSEFHKLQTWIEKSKRSSTYAVGIPGRIERPAGQAPVCILAVNGSQYPHLIQEKYYWQVFFRAKVAALASGRTVDGSASSTHIAAIQRHHARIPEQHIQILLKIAEGAVNALNAIERKAERSPEFQETLADDIAMTVMSARADLIRRLPEAS
jgi:hypothetical protein